MKASSPYIVPKYSEYPVLNSLHPFTCAAGMHVLEWASVVLLAAALRRFAAALRRTLCFYTAAQTPEGQGI